MKLKRAIADFLLSLAIRLGAKRVTVTVIKDGYTQAAAEAIFTARPNWGANEAKAVEQPVTSSAVATAMAARVFISFFANALVPLNGANDWT